MWPPTIATILRAVSVTREADRFSTNKDIPDYSALGKYVDFTSQNYSVPVKTKSLYVANSQSGLCSSTYGEQEKMEVGRGTGLLNDTSGPACCVQRAGFVDSSKPRTVMQQAPM